MGRLKGRCRWVRLADLQDGEDVGFLREGWIEEKGEDEHVEALVQSLGAGWTANHVWGFAEAGGSRRFLRRVIVRKGDEVRRVRLVYDSTGA